MRILYLANLRLPTEKAYGIQIAKMCEAFSRAGGTVTLAIPYRRNLIREDFFDFYGISRAFEVRRLPAFDFYLPGMFDRWAVGVKNFFSALTLAAYALSRSDDVIYSRDEGALFLLSLFHRKLCFEAHSFSKRKNFFYRRFLRKNLRIVTTTNSLRKEFIILGFKPEDVLVAADGVDIQDFQVKQTPQECRAMLDLPLKKKLIGYVGQFKTLGMEKGMHIFIEALKLLCQKQDDYAGVVVGGSTRDIDPYRQGLQALPILFVEQQKHTLIPFYLKAFDVVVMPFPSNHHYAYYMSPLKLFEYMASGRPIVASDLPSIREILNEQNAFLVKPDDHQALAAGIQHALNDPYTRAIAKKAQGNAGYYTWYTRAKSILRFINN